MFSVRDRSRFGVAGLDLDLHCAPLTLSFFCTVLSMLSPVTDSIGELGFLADAVADPSLSSSSVDLPLALIGASKSFAPGSLSSSSFGLESAVALSTTSSSWDLGVLNGFLILPSRFELFLELKS